MEEKLVKYVGLADAHGIEGIKPYVENDTFSSYCILRALSNRQRHAVAFFVDMTDNQFKSVAKLMNVDKFQAALKEVKKYATKNNSLDLVTESMGNVISSWNLIPNPALDPWRF